MKREELLKMLKNMDSLSRFVYQQFAYMPWSATGIIMAEKVQSVKYGIAKLLEEFDRRHDSLNQAHGG